MPENSDKRTTGIAKQFIPALDQHPPDTLALQLRGNTTIGANPAPTTVSPSEPRVTGL